MSRTSHQLSEREHPNHYDPNIRCRQVIASGKHNVELQVPFFKGFETNLFLRSQEKPGVHH
jgi:hypothetical protein